MKFRLRMLGLHFASSATVLLLVLGALYLGWYRWPGWYLTGVLHVVPVMVGVDVALGPLLTFVIANPAKTRRQLTRDIGVIVLVQLVALGYGTIQLWQGRPLYYAFSENQLQVVQAYDLDPAEITLGQKRNPGFAPHWYSLPRWIWAPLPDDSKTRDSIVTSAVTGGYDVTAMPRYFQAWPLGLPALRKQLKKVDEEGYFSKARQKTLKQRMAALGFAPDAAIVMPMTGREMPLLAVFDPTSARIEVILTADP